MDSNDLKMLAEYMGHRTLMDLTGSDVLISKVTIKSEKKEYGYITYNPLQNNDQLVELIEKLKMDIVYWHQSKEWSAEITDKNGKPTTGVYGETLAEAVVNAAIEMVKGE